MDAATAPTLADTPLRAHLRREGRQQRWLAERTDIRPDRLSLIVRGFLPDPEEAVAIASVLGVAVSDLWEIERPGRMKAGPKRSGPTVRQHRRAGSTIPT